MTKRSKTQQRLGRERLAYFKLRQSELLPDFIEVHQHTEFHFALKHVPLGGPMVHLDYYPTTGRLHDQFNAITHENVQPDDLRDLITTML